MESGIEKKGKEIWRMESKRESYVCVFLQKEDYNVVSIVSWKQNEFFLLFFYLLYYTLV